MSKYKMWILLVLCNLFWAGNYIFGKYVGAEMSPLQITFSRWFLASIILVVVAAVFEKPEWKEVLKLWQPLAAMAVLGIIGYTFMVYYALRFTSSTNAALVNTINPAMIAIAAAIYLKEKMSRLQVAGVVLSLVGVFVVLTGGNLLQLFQVHYNKGDLIMVVAMGVWTIYSMVGKQIKEIPPITATAVSSAMAAVIMAPFVLYQGMNVAALSPMAWTGIIYITIFPSVISFVIWNIGVKELGANKTGIFLNLIPVFTAIISWALGNQITAAQVIGGLLVFAGVYLTMGMLDKKLKEVS
jgi:drug/metabolite transporter (DMT)-like permease